MLIELAPHHKYGLPIAAPVMPAAGTFGYGEAYHDLIAVHDLGAIVTNPVSWRPWRAASGPRIVLHDESFLVHTGHPNPGLRKVVRQHRQGWEHLDVPIIVHLLATTPPDVAEAAAWLSGSRHVAGIELGLAADVTPEQAAILLEAAQTEGDLPVIARVPFGRVGELAPLLAEEGADALTLTAPPRGMLTVDDDGGHRFVRGRLYGRALFPLLLNELSQWAKKIPAPVIACGGIATPDEAQACLDVGAVAVQIDALLWRTPEMVNEMLQHLAALPEPDEGLER